MFLRQRSLMKRRVGKTPDSGPFAKVAPGGKYDAEDYLPVEEYRRIKEDPIASWGLLDDTAWLLRLSSIAGAVFVASLPITAGVYPLTSETGELLPQNLASSALFASALSMLAVFSLMLILTGQWNQLRQRLLQKTYIVEDATGQKRGTGGFYSFSKTKSEVEQRKDLLLAENVADPALNRAKAYLLGSIGGCLVAAAAAANAGGEFRMAKSGERMEPGYCQSSYWKASGGAVGECRSSS